MVDGDGLGFAGFDFGFGGAQEAPFSAALENGFPGSDLQNKFVLFYRIWWLFHGDVGVLRFSDGVFAAQFLHQVIYLQPPPLSSSLRNKKAGPFGAAALQ